MRALAAVARAAEQARALEQVPGAEQAPAVQCPLLWNLAPTREPMAGPARARTSTVVKVTRPKPEATMPEADPSSRARRSGSVPLCAAWLGIICGLWAPGCLNPMPDEQPSAGRNQTPAFGQQNPSDTQTDGSGGGLVGELPPGNTPAEPSNPGGGLITEGAAPVADAGVPDAAFTGDDDGEGTLR